ncbi:MAG: redox-sensing transcriptional repressor Rex [Spirochaetaceae bacterium]|nr:MAG: redox-sensing transcriptional repressor Rex [Spirochaetaceae bacterium]
MNKTILLRLAKYIRILKQLRALGFVKVFSNNLGDAIGVTAAVVRKDFSMINIPGNKRGGYNIDVLIENILDVLGRKDDHTIVVVGCGRIGSALIEYHEFQREGIHVAAGFDIDPDRLDVNADVPIYHISQLKEVVHNLGVTVGVIAVPDNQAAAVFDQMIEAGIRGFLNFTPVELRRPSHGIEPGSAVECEVQNVNIGLEIENLFYLVRMRRVINPGAPE